VSSVSDQHKRSLWFTAFVTSLALPLAYHCVKIVIAAINGESVVGEASRAFVVVFVIEFPFMLVVTFLLALPALLLLRELRRLIAVNVFAVGGVAGIVTVMIVQLVRPLPFEWMPMTMGLCVGVGAGELQRVLGGLVRDAHALQLLHRPFFGFLLRQLAHPHG
jgi:hypothetical protein